MIMNPKRNRLRKIVNPYNVKWLHITDFRYLMSKIAKTRIILCFNILYFYMRKKVTA